MNGGAGSSRTPLPFVKWMGSAATLAVLIALLSGLTALASYQGATAGSGQRTIEAQARRILDEATATYAAASQEIIRDYARYDSWYLHREDPGQPAGYPADFSPALVAALGRSAEDPFDTAYHEEMYAEADSRFAEAARRFDLARQHDERANRLQLVVMTAALGLAFAAWASLLRAQSRLRLGLAALAIVALVVGSAVCFATPAVPG